MQLEEYQEANPRNGANLIIGPSERMARLEDQLVFIENRQTELLRTHEELHSCCEMLCRSLDEVQQLKAEMNFLQNAQLRLEQKMDYLERTVVDFEENARQQELLQASHYGQFLWKITEFSRRRNEAVSCQQESFYSPCFYTSRYGYKMCARIYLNGDGMGRGTHISVFFVVMRGQYDALLRWPFGQKVTFMLMDQDNVEHVIDAFRPDPSSSSFQRPRRETNIASGCPMFCSLNELNNHAYIRDDTMFLKIAVDTSDL